MGRLKKSEKKVGCGHSAEETRTNARIPPLIHPSVRRFPFGVPSGVLRVVPNGIDCRPLRIRIERRVRPFRFEFERRDRPDVRRLFPRRHAGRLIPLRFAQRQRKRPYRRGFLRNSGNRFDIFEIVGRRLRGLLRFRRSRGIRRLRRLLNPVVERRALGGKFRGHDPSHHCHVKRFDPLPRREVGIRNRPEGILIRIS